MVGALVGLVVCVLFSALFSGSETAVYTVSRLRVEAEAEAGSRGARRALSLLRDDAGLLVTVLIGNNLALELATHFANAGLAGLGELTRTQRELAVTLTLTPVLFLFAELLPKDLFRRRPFFFLVRVAAILGAFRLLFLPLAKPVQLFSAFVQRLAGVRPDDLARAAGREAVLEVLEESTRAGAIESRAELMARNALTLAAIPVRRVMTPWVRVEVLDLDGPAGVDLAGSVAAAHHTRLPVVQAGVVCGYLHQLEHLWARRQAAAADATPGPFPGEAPGEAPGVTPGLRPLLCLEPGTSVQRALLRLRAAGLRMAVVGTPEEPLGLVGLKDLAERISGDLAGW